MEPKLWIRKYILNEEEKFYRTLYEASKINTESPGAMRSLKTN